MKKFGLFLIAALAGTAFTSCNDDDGDYPKYSPLITTVHSLDGGDYYFQRDNGETLYPGDKSRVPGYKPDPDKTQRTIIWFNLLSGIEGYDYNIALYNVENIFTGTSMIVDTQEQLDELGSEKTGFQNNTFNLTKEWLTFYALYPVSDNSKHDFTVIVNNVESGSEPAPADGAVLNIWC